MRQKKSFDKRGAFALTQVFILIIGIIAISYAIESEIPTVKAINEPTAPPAPTTTNMPTPFSYEPSITYRGEGEASLGGTDGAVPPPTKKPVVEPTAAAGAEFGIATVGTNLLHASAIAGALYFLLPLAGASQEAAKASALASFSGVFIGETLANYLIAEEVTKSTAIWWGAGTGIVVAAVIFYLTYKKEETRMVTFTCQPWEAPVGGENCEKCNKQNLPCSEYQCRSLGQSCELVNPGTSEELCTWVNRLDTNPPVIQPWEDALISEEYRYTPDNTISPPDRGVKIEFEPSTTKCVKAFTPLSFGINVNEPAKCKMDYLGKATFDEMEFYFGGSSILKYNHTQVMSLPGPSALAAGNATIQNDGDYGLFVRCQDANGNSNVANFVFKFCVEKGPDTTPPLITATNLINNMPIAFNQSSVDIKIYTNEPADCKWSHLDLTYDNMETPMACARGITEINAQMLYECSTTLTGLNDGVENKFYFRCKDQPGVADEERNANVESYPFILIGTRPLVIDSAGPSGLIKDSTDVVKAILNAKTSAGYKDGDATCYYREKADSGDTGEAGNYIMFLYEKGTSSSYQHSQDLFLPAGEYKYFIKCVDLGGNSDLKEVSFSIETDTSEPFVIRAYHSETYLKIITNEKGDCVYDTVDCSYPFEEGLVMPNVDGIEHYIDWNSQKNFYIKCQDIYKNQPLPNACNIIVKPFEEFKKIE